MDCRPTCPTSYLSGTTRVCIFDSNLVRSMLLICARFVCAVFATHISVGNNPFRPMQLSCILLTKAAVLLGGQDASGTRKINVAS